MALQTLFHARTASEKCEADAVLDNASHKRKRGQGTVKKTAVKSFTSFVGEEHHEPGGESRERGLEIPRATIKSNTSNAHCPGQLSVMMKTLRLSGIRPLKCSSGTRAAVQLSAANGSESSRSELLKTGTPSTELTSL